MTPKNRAELKDYCLRNLGFPVIQINVDDDQLDDRMEDALTLFRTNHYDGTTEQLIAYQITQEDIDRRWFDVSGIEPAVIAITHIYPFSSYAAIGINLNIWDVNYQVRLSDLYNYTSPSYAYFGSVQHHLAELENIFVGQQPFRYSKYDGRVYIDMNWRLKTTPGMWVLFEAKQIIPEENEQFWSDPWLIKYVTALFKQQWGNNIKKFDGVKLPGGITMNGQQIYREAVDEVAALERELRAAYEAPPVPFIG